MALQVVNEWTFQKDGADVEMRDISNDTKSAQLDSRDTFLGVGQNRCCQLLQAPGRDLVDLVTRLGQHVLQG